MPHETFEAACRFLTEAAERDAGAFRAVLRAYEQPREQRLAEVEQAVHEAARVPLEGYAPGRIDVQLSAASCHLY